MKRSLMALMAIAVFAGCQDLTVPNENAPDRRRALTSAADVQTLVASSFRALWTRFHNGSTAYNTMPLVADELTGTYANDAALELSSEPRPAFNNNPTAAAHSVARSPWESFYTAISSANDGLFAMANGLKIIDEDGVDTTDRLWAYGKFMQAYAHGWVSLLFDQGFVFHETTELPQDIGAIRDLVPLLPHHEVRDSAIAYMLEAIELMKETPFTTEAAWIGDRERKSEDLIKLGHSFIAQLYVYGARTPEERANLPWGTILDHLEKGITEDFEIDMTGTNGFHSYVLYRAQRTVDTFSAWGDYKLIGPADTGGNFAAWLAEPRNDRVRFEIETPDRRITGDTPQSPGAYFIYRPHNIFSPDRGTYHHSHYQWYRNEGRYYTGHWYLMTVDEMNLLKAEALYYLNRRDEAADLVNLTRTRGHTTLVTADYPAVTYTENLPPVTADGVPESENCVPRLDGETCADLLGAIMYERMIETMLINAFRGYLDSRGWGRLPNGTFLHMPIPGRELTALAMPIYTFGGAGSEGSAVCSQPFCDDY